MKTFEGKVLSLKMQKTAIVEVTVGKKHPLYKKVLKREKRYKVDTEGFTLKEGDSVLISQTRPISKDKHFKISKIVAKNEKKGEKNDSA